MIQQRLIKHQRRFASQEINPILLRLNYQYSKQQLPLAFDRNPSRTWSHVFYSPHQLRSSPMYATHAPFTQQYLRLKKYLDGYYEDKVIISQPHVYRTMAGNLVRLFVYNPQRVDMQLNGLQSALERVFGQYQGPGTSGRPAHRLLADDASTGQGHVKVRLDVVELSSPMLNADVLAQYVGRQLAQFTTASTIFDRLIATIEDDTPRHAPEPNASGLEIAGLRLRISGRPKGEEMAVKHDFLYGSCPKLDDTALIDYGKHAVLLRSGMVGVKAWVHFQRPHREDETGRVEMLHRLNYSNGGVEGAEGEESANGNDLPSLLARDLDYAPENVAEVMKKKQMCRSNGLWNAQSIQDKEISSLTHLLKDLHTPDNHHESRFIW